MSAGNEGVYFAASSKCHDCGVEIPCNPWGQVIPGHECRSDDIRARQAFLSGWEEGYRWAVENPDDDLVQADARSFGTGWIRRIRQGHIGIEVSPDAVGEDL